MKLVDQWRTIEDALPPGWEDVRLTLTTEQPSDLPRAAQVLGSINVGKVGSALVFHVTRAGGVQGPQAAKRLFERLDNERTWCTLEQSRVELAETAPEQPHADAGPSRRSVAESWDAALAPLPDDWTDLLCEIELESSDAPRPNGAPVRAAEPDARSVPPRVHLPLLGAVGLRRLTLDGATLLRASRRRRDRWPRPASSVSSPTPTTSTPRGPCGSWVARRSRAAPRALSSAEPALAPPQNRGRRFAARAAPRRAPS